MNRSFLLCAAACSLAACADVTAPTATADLSPSYAKPSTSVFTVLGNLQNNTFAFTADGLGMTGSGSTTLEIQDEEAQSIAALPTEEMPAHPGNHVLGKLSNQQVVIGIKPGATKYEIALDFYAIGSWDGRGQQAQSGAFGQDSWSISAECGTQLVDIFTTSFSNQKSVQQHYPSTLAGKPTQWLKESEGSNVTGFDAIIPLFSSVKDSWYYLTFKGANPCGNAEFKSIRLFIPGFDLQGRGDESWAVDNLVIKTDNN
jgi:hypothetical protein